MKTQLEKLELCKVCKNRAFDPSCGIVCGLTNAKPEFEDECTDHIADEVQVKQQTAKIEYNSTDISGWLSIFLWLGLCGGAVMTIIFGMAQVINNGALAIILQAIYIAPLVVVAIAAIVAFYKRKPNAVSLARTYIVMIILDAIISLVVMALTKDTEPAFMAFRQFIWAAIWMTFLQVSDDVKAVIPHEIRKWKAFEKIMLAIFTLIGVAMLLFITIFTKPELIAKVSDNFIELSIQEANKTLPQKIEEGLQFNKIVKENQSIVYIYQFPDYRISDFEQAFLKECSKSGEDDILSSLRERNPENEFLIGCLEAGYDIVFRYTDANKTLLYDITITPEEYKAAIAR